MVPLLSHPFNPAPPVPNASSSSSHWSPRDTQHTQLSLTEPHSPHLWPSSQAFIRPAHTYRVLSMFSISEGRNPLETRYVGLWERWASRSWSSEWRTSPQWSHRFREDCEQFRERQGKQVQGWGSLGGEVARELKVLLGQPWLSQELWQPRPSKIITKNKNLVPQCPSFFLQHLVCCKFS